MKLDRNGGTGMRRFNNQNSKKQWQGSGLTFAEKYERERSSEGGSRMAKKGIGRRKRKEEAEVTDNGSEIGCCCWGGRSMVDGG